MGRTAQQPPAKTARPCGPVCFPQFIEARRTLALAFHTAFGSAPFPGTSGAATRSEGSASAAMMGAAAQLESLRDGCFTIDEGALPSGGAAPNPPPAAGRRSSTDGGKGPARV
jgi:hypothetical protein